MSEHHSGPELPVDSETLARRQFLKNAGKVGATAPAVALLMAASFKSEQASAQYTTPTIPQT